jgi:hypothetical protein
MAGLKVYEDKRIICHLSDVVNDRVVLWKCFLHHVIQTLCLGHVGGDRNLSKNLRDATPNDLPEGPCALSCTLIKTVFAPEKHRLCRGYSSYANTAGIIWLCRGWCVQVL